MKKDAAFLLILALGISYVVFLVTFTKETIPNLVTQVGFVWQLIVTHCDPQTIIRSTGLYVGIALGAVVLLLWVNLVMAILRSALSVMRTNRYLAGLDLEQIDDLTYKLKSGEITAFTAGILRPKVYVSQAIFTKFSKRELQSVICHESFHARTYDPLRKLIIDFVSHLLPSFPYKRMLFHNYDVLSELSADEYAELKLHNKRSIISALHKIFSLTQANLNLSMFGLYHDRIGILVGEEQFKTRQFFTALLIAGVVFMSNSLLVSQVNLLINCERAFAAVTTANGQTGAARSMVGICNLPETTWRSFSDAISTRSSHI